MTRKDYVKLAAALVWARPAIGKASAFKPREQFYRMRAWETTVIVIADTLKEDNVRFDYTRFFKAVGLER